MNEKKIEQKLIDKLTDQKYVHRKDIKDRASLEKNFRKNFEDLNHVKLTYNEFVRLMKQIIIPIEYDANKALKKYGTYILKSTKQP